MVMNMKILRRQVEVEYHIKRSVFIGVSAPVMTEDEAKDFIAKVREKYSDATHVAWAYVIHTIEGYSDAGEPAGTAGPPILRALKGAGVTHGVICVIRYFGGIKLGKRGLIDAYGHTAKLVIEKAGVAEAREGYIVEITHTYDVKIDGILRSLGIDVRELSPHYEEVVRWTLKVDKDMYDKLVQSLKHLDGVQIDIKGSTLVEVS
jgi:uncharacterized YigZ family protein